MTGDELLEHTRKVVLRDINTPSLWSDETILRRLSEGLFKVAHRVHHLVAEDRELALTADEVVYELDDDVMAIYSVELDGYVGKLQPSTEGWTPNDTVRIRPTRYTMDRGTRQIRFYGIPDADYTAIMRVARLPVALTEDNLSDDVELPEEYQLFLADWAAYRCFSDDDADGRNDGAAEKAEARFYKGLADVKRDTYRQKIGSSMRARGLRVK